MSSSFGGLNKPCFNLKSFVCINATLKLDLNCLLNCFWHLPFIRLNSGFDFHEPYLYKNDLRPDSFVTYPN